MENYDLDSVISVDITAQIKIISKNILYKNEKHKVKIIVMLITYIIPYYILHNIKSNMNLDFPIY